MEQKHEEEQLNLKNTVNIGAAFPRWASLRTDKRFQSDAELAWFLLDSYERGVTASAPRDGKPFEATAPAASTIGASEVTDRRLCSKVKTEVDMHQVKRLQLEEPRELSFVPPMLAESEKSVQTQVGGGLVFPSNGQQDQQDQKDPDLLRIKEEPEEVLTTQEGEYLNGLEEADIPKFPFTAVTVKSEDEEEKPQVSQLHQNQMEHKTEAEPLSCCSAKQIKTESDGENSEQPEPTRNLGSLLQENTDGKTLVSYKTEVSIGGDSEAGGNNEKHGWQKPLSESSETEDSDCHESEAHESGAFSCSECGKRFYYKWSLQRHMIKHSEKGSSSSFTNDKCFVEQTKDLQTVYSGEKPFGCNVCGQRFRDQYNLNRHIRIHTGEKPFGCGVCGKRFNGEGNLKIHKRIHTGEKPFGCGVCGKKFKQRSHFKKHVAVHTEDRPFGCDVCGKEFKWRIHLKTHMRIHTEEKPFGCDVCGRRFNFKRNLKIHVRIHTEERSFGCDVCGRRFHCSRNLKLHKKVHTGEKPFACGICSKRFSQVGARNRHRLVHSEEKPFSCDLCGLRFNREGNLNRHLRVHTGEKPFGCDICGQKFTREASLRRHMRSKAINHINVEKELQKPDDLMSH